MHVVAVAVVPEDIPTRNTPGRITLQCLADLQVLQDAFKHATALHFTHRSIREDIVYFCAVVGVDEQHQLSLYDQYGHLGVVNKVLREER